MKLTNITCPMHNKEFNDLKKYFEDQGHSKKDADAKVHVLYFRNGGKMPSIEEAKTIMNQPKTTTVLKTEQQEKPAEQPELSDEEIVKAFEAEYNKKFKTNLDRIATDEGVKDFIKDSDEIYYDKLVEAAGGTLTNQDVKEAAQSLGAFKGMTKEQQRKLLAEILNLREQHVKLAEDIVNNNRPLTKEFLDSMVKKVQSSSLAGRLLQSFNIAAKSSPEVSQMNAVIKKIIEETNVSMDQIQEAAKGINWNNQESVTKFYRTFVKPRFSEIIDEFVYANLLSSPITHIINSTSNALQTFVLHPSLRVLTGQKGSAFKSYLKNIVPAYEEAAKSFKGEKISGRPDINQLRTNSPWTSWSYPISNFLEAQDTFFRKLISDMEYDTKRGNKELSKAESMKLRAEADAIADYTVFRARLDPNNKTGQGDLLSKIDKFTNMVLNVRKQFPLSKWFIRFVTTPMNIFKQGIEYSPLGVATLKGASNKSEQLAKSGIGSLVFGAGMTLALAGLTTWSTPRKEEEKKKFFASGRQPYSIKLGNKWYPYSRLGPLAYPIAMAAAINYHWNERPDAKYMSGIEKFSVAALGIMKFFSDQSYLQGIGDMVKAGQGDETLLKSLVSNSASQMVPLSSLIRWANTSFIDPVFRKPKSDSSVEDFKQHIMTGIPFMSKYVPAVKDEFGHDEKRNYENLFGFIPSWISPIKVTKENEAGEARYQSYKKIEALKEKQKQIREQIKSRMKGNQ